MTVPGYGPSGFWIPPVGLNSWDGSPPPVLKAEDPPELPAIALGFGAIPRRVQERADVFVVKGA